MSEPIVLGGRKFSPISRPTFRQELWIGSIALRAGVVRVFPAQGEAFEDFAHRVVSEANDRGYLFDLLGSALLPDGMNPEDWTAEVARETGMYIGSLQDEPDLKRARRLIAEVLIPFMLAGPASSNATGTALPGSAAVPGAGTISPSSETGNRSSEG